MTCVECINMKSNKCYGIETHNKDKKVLVSIKIRMEKKKEEYQDVVITKGRKLNIEFEKNTNTNDQLKFIFDKLHNVLMKNLEKKKAAILKKDEEHTNKYVEATLDGIEAVGHLKFGI